MCLSSYLKFDNINSLNICAQFKRMDVVVTGNYNKDLIQGYRVHKVLRPGFTLHVGSECNDGRPITESWRYKQALKLGIPIVTQKKRERPKVAPKYEDKELLVDKYTPKSLTDIIGHREQINEIGQWLQIWENGIPGDRGVLVSGPPGIGKTTTVHLIAQHFGYKVRELNASDTRSVTMLRGQFALGIKRLVKELIVLDEIDGLSERGGVGEIASIIKKTNVPIICISNEKPPKLRPIINVCLDIKFNRPNKSTIANALLKVAAAEKIEINKVELEGLCESSGNDIRSILNSLEFYGGEGASNKDANLRLDLFSATQRLFSSKKAGLDESAGLVFVDYNMVPLMVQEAYLSASRDSLEDACRAAEFLSAGDIMDKRIHQKQAWHLLPHYVQSVVSVVKSVSGFAPFQIFPQWLGKNSKRLKHKRYVDDLASKMRTSNGAFRLDYADAIQGILLGGLQGDKPDIKGVIQAIDELGLTRDELMDNLAEFMFDKLDIPTKVKTAFTREYNKMYPDRKVGKKTVKEESKVEEDSEEEEEVEEINQMEL
jgi:replication factor C subunit 1